MSQMKTNAFNLDNHVVILQLALVGNGKSGGGARKYERALLIQRFAIRLLEGRSHVMARWRRIELNEQLLNPACV